MLSKIKSFKLMWLFFNVVMSEQGCVFQVDKEQGGVLADCKKLGLRHIPQNFPPNTISIYLDFNMIPSIKSNSFANLPNLRHLNLSHNRITHLETLAFHHCQNLSHLDLSFNQLILDDASYPDTVFDSLDHLQSLNLMANKFDDQSGNMSGRIFQRLRRLTSLTMDINDEVYFGEGFSSLTSLKSLCLHGQIRILRNDTFQNLMEIKLKCLSITPIAINNIETGTFAPLRHVSDFQITKCIQGIKHLFKSTRCFSGRTMDAINLSRIPKGKKGVQLISDSILDADTLSNVSHVCIRKLILSGNHLMYIDLNSLRHKTLATCLRHLDVSHNWLHVMGLFGVTSLIAFPNLEHIDISDQVSGAECTHASSTSTLRSERDYFTESYKTHYFIYLPKNLTYVNCCSVTKNNQRVDGLTFLNGGSLRILNISFMGLTSVSCPVAGIQGLISLDVSGNEKLQLCDDVSKSFSELENVYFNYFSLQQDALSRQGKRLLQPLTRLRSLHLSFNRLWHLPPDIFSANPMLEYLDLSNNIFQLFPFDLTSLPLVHVVDLSSNTLGYIQPVSQKQITKHMINLHRNFTFLLHGNILACGCQNFEFLTWLEETSERLSNGQNLTCLLSNGHLSNTVEVFENMTFLWRKCTGFTVFFSTLTLLMAFMASVFVVLLIQTNRTVVVNTFINLLKKQVNKPTRLTFRYDVYLAYAEVDYQWICHCLGPMLEDGDLRVFLWERDSVPGDSTPDQITDNIFRSWKVVVYFTEAFRQDQWWYLTMMTALSRVDSVSPDRLVLLLPEWEKPFIPNCITDTVPERCIVSLPNDVMFNHRFWDDLVDAIKKA